MRGMYSRWRWLTARVLGSLTAPALLTLVGNGTADEPASLPPTVPAATRTEALHVNVLTLQACRQIALERQPAIAAAQSTLAAAVDRAHALDSLHTPRFLAPDLPIRRQQASLGVTIAQAGVQQTESDILYGVTYSYLAVLYARQQEKTLDEVHDSLKNLYNSLNQELASGGEVNKQEVDLAHSYLLALEGRREEARQGSRRALVALREAMGVGPDFCFDVLTRALPCPAVEVDCCALVNLALARRGDVVQAATMAQVTGLEVDAQSVLRGPRGRTFATGSDIHARPIPTGSYGLTYRPAALGPEMPTMIPGKRPGRVSQAQDYSSRAAAVADKTRNLVAAEAEEACLTWKDRSVRARKLREAARLALSYSKRQRSDYNNKTPEGARKARLVDVLNAGFVTTQLRIDATEAQFHALVALAMLERVTAGGYCLDFDALPPCQEEGADAGKNGMKAASKGPKQ